MFRGVCLARGSRACSCVGRLSRGRVWRWLLGPAGVAAWDAVLPRVLAFRFHDPSLPLRVRSSGLPRSTLHALASRRTRSPITLLAPEGGSTRGGGSQGGHAWDPLRKLSLFTGRHCRWEVQKECLGCAPDQRRLPERRHEAAPQSPSRSYTYCREAFAQGARLLGTSALQAAGEWHAALRREWEKPPGAGNFRGRRGPDLEGLVPQPPPEGSERGFSSGA